MLLALFEKQAPQQHFNHAATSEQADTTPMEGVNPQALEKLLELKKQGLKSTAVLVLGYRDEKTDWLVNLKK